MRLEILKLAVVVTLGTLGIAGNAGAQPSDDRAKARAEAKARTLSHRTSISFLGVGVAEIDADRAKALNLKEERGVEIKRVDEESPAAKAGLKENDVVLEYNGQRVEGAEQFTRLVRETPAGRQSKLLISRGVTFRRKGSEAGVEAFVLKDAKWTAPEGGGPEAIRGVSVDGIEIDVPVDDVEADDVKRLRDSLPRAAPAMSGD